ncbi:acyl carrier protein [Nocardia sp. NPDC058518]|uniref:acyl carrier protein n=1 Tax=Nocardia sp. NPDC058518 TaxID=3346534 RepID=UPI0036633541
MTESEFVELIVNETGLLYVAEDLDTPFDSLNEWDSVYLMKLLTGIESITGNTLEMSELIEVTSLGDLYRAVAAQAAS